jgi:hypothetical protein
VSLFQPVGGKTHPAVLVDTQTGTVLEASHVVAVPAEVWNENGMEDKTAEGMSDSAIADFGARYGVPLFVRVNNG